MSARRHAPSIKLKHSATTVDIGRFKFGQLGQASKRKRVSQGHAGCLLTRKADLQFREVGSMYAHPA
jgi:hypothetical protein